MRRAPTWFLLVSACSSSSSLPLADAPPAGASDAPAAAVDGPPGAAGDAPQHDAPAASTDGGGGSFTCAVTLDEYCSVASLCVRHAADLPTCGAGDGTLACGGGGTGSARTESGNATQTSYYDGAGNLIGILVSNSGQTTCLAGPATLTAPACGAVSPLQSCQDAGL